jgi:SAM-dependent methyltransferase
MVSEIKFSGNQFSSLPSQYMPSSSWSGYTNLALNQRPIFLVSNESLEKNIIESILKSRSRFFVLSETFFYSKIRSLLDVKEDRIQLTCITSIIDFINDILKGSASLKQYVIRQIQSNNLSPKMLFEAIVYDQLIANFPQKDIADILWLEKTLEHVKYLDVINRFYPEAKIILILKRPRSSQTIPNNRFSNNEIKDDDRLKAEFFKTLETKILANICIIHFNNLIKNKINVIRKIDSFIEKGWEDSGQINSSPICSTDEGRSDCLKINYSTESMLGYQKWVFQKIYKNKELSGSQVLEIGGVPEQIGISENLIYNGAQKVIQINNRQSKNRNKRVAPKIEYVKMDARKTFFSDSTFDIIFGAAVLEHMLDLKQFLIEMYRIMKTDGILVLHGGPLWGSAWGHHLWVDCGTIKYRFNDINPLPNWSHLYMDDKKMAGYLSNIGIPKDHVNKIVHWCYESEEINRLMYDDYITIFDSSLFRNVCFKKKQMAYPSKEVLNRINEIYESIDSEFCNSELLVVAKK